MKESCSIRPSSGWAEARTPAPARLRARIARSIGVIPKTIDVTFANGRYCSQRDQSARASRVADPPVLGLEKSRQERIDAEQAVAGQLDAVILDDQVVVHPQRGP